MARYKLLLCPIMSYSLLLLHVFIFIQAASDLASGISLRLDPLSFWCTFIILWAFWTILTLVWVFLWPHDMPDVSFVFSDQSVVDLSLKGIVSAEWRLLFTNQGTVGSVFMSPPFQALSVFNSTPWFILVFFYLPLWQWNVRPLLSSNIYLFVHTPSSSLPVIAIIPTLLSQHPSCGHLSHLIWIPEVPSPPVSLPNELLD